MVIPLEVLLLFIIVFVIPDEFESCSIYMRNCLGILMVIELNLSFPFGKMPIFTILILPNNKHERSYHLLMSSSISFFQNIEILAIHVFHLLGYSCPKILYTICNYCECCCVLHFFFSPFILCVEKGY